MLDECILWHLLVFLCSPFIPSLLRVHSVQISCTPESLLLTFALILP